MLCELTQDCFFPGVIHCLLFCHNLSHCCHLCLFQAHAGVRACLCEALSCWVQSLEVLHKHTVVYWLFLSRQECHQLFIRCFGSLMKGLLPRGSSGFVVHLVRIQGRKRLPLLGMLFWDRLAAALGQIWSWTVGKDILTAFTAELFSSYTNCSLSTQMWPGFCPSFPSVHVPLFPSTCSTPCWLSTHRRALGESFRPALLSLFSFSGRWGRWLGWVLRSYLCVSLHCCLCTFREPVCLEIIQS